MWSGKRDLNPQPSAWEADTLPLSYSRPKGQFFVERETGFEPATSTLARLHSTTELLPRICTAYPPIVFLEATSRFELENGGFADLCLTTWLCRLMLWSGRRDLNPRLQPWQGCTLPLSYSRAYARHIHRSFFWRRHPDLNWRMEVLQTSALPLGYVALCCGAGDGI